jgi:hypothetical protein
MATQPKINPATEATAGGYASSIEQIGQNAVSPATNDVNNPSAYINTTNQKISNSPFVAPISLDDFFQTTPIGSINKAIGNNLYGLNHQQIPNMVSANWDLYGLTFFTRPQLNLQSDNIRNVRQLYPLLNNADESIQKFVRLTLDPRLQWGYDPQSVQSSVNQTAANIISQAFQGSGQIRSAIVDPHMAFIPVLTNNINSISGWPDLVAPTFSSSKGLYGESYSQVDGSIKYFETFDLDVTFRNSRGDPIVYMFYIWLWYMSMVFEGYMVPYPDFIAENELDYCTRIYRLVLDSTRTYVKKIAATGAAFPLSIPMGSFFDYTNEKPYNDQNKDITIRFRSNGVTYMDDILIYEFNKTVGIFQPSILTILKNGGSASQVGNLIKVNKNLLPFFNNRGYPYIDPNTYELQWWVDADEFRNRLAALNQFTEFYQPDNQDATNPNAPTVQFPSN